MSQSGPEPLPIPGEWVTLVDGYVRALRAMGRPETSITTRRSHIARIARQLQMAPLEVTPDVLRDWFASQTQWKIETRRSYRNSCVQFFRWAHTDGPLPSDPAAAMAPIAPDHPVPRPAPDRVWRKAKMAADPRVMLMLRLAAEPGLRRAEVAQVHTRDLREGFDGPQLLVHGKGARERVVPISDDLADAIERGPAGHTDGAPTEGFLFPGQINGHLSPRRVGELCAEAMPDIWTMHSLRHRCATEAFRGTRNLRAVQKMLGHSSLAVTERYVAVDDSEIREAMMAATRAASRCATVSSYGAAG